MKITTTIATIFFFSFKLFCQNISNLEHTLGPEGFGFSSLYSNENYAFSDGIYGLYRTSDGFNWETISEEVGYPMAIFGDTLIMQTSVVSLEGFPQERKFLVSYDNGENWIINKMPPNQISGGSMVICSHGIYVADNQNHLIYHSTDHGITWETLQAPQDYLSDFYVFEDRLYLSGSISLYRSDTDGKNWEKLNPPLEPQQYIIDILAINEHLLLTVEQGLWHSHDDGVTWTFKAYEFGNVTELMERIGNTVYFIGSDELIRTTDFGYNLEIPDDPSSSIFSGYSHTAFNGSILLSTYNKGIVNWNESSSTSVYVNEGLNSPAVYDFVESKGKIWAACGNGLFSFDPVQDTWSGAANIPSDTEEYYGIQAIQANGTGVLIANSVSDDYFYLSSDDGQNWLRKIIPNEVAFLEELTLIDNNLMGVSLFGAKISRDLGQTWEDINAPGRVIKFGNKYLSSNSNIIAASDDQGTSWYELYNTNASIEWDWIRGIQVAGDRVFGFFETTNGTKLYTSVDGIDWNYAHDGIPNTNSPLFQETFSCYHYLGDYYFYNEYLGLFVSKDDANSWLPVMPLRNQNIFLHEDWFYVGGFHGGVGRFNPPDPNGGLMSGIVYFDEDTNGIPNIDEPRLPNVNVNLVGQNNNTPYYFTNTNLAGEYALGVYSNSADTLRPDLKSNYIESINPPFYLSNEVNSSKDFGVSLTPNITDLSIYGKYYSVLRPGFDGKIFLKYKNEGTIPSNGKVTLKLDPTMTYLGASPEPSEILGDSLVWDYDNLILFDAENISVDVNIDSNAELDREVCTNIKVITDSPDILLSNNSYSIKTFIRGSFDPNDKMVEPEEGLNEEEIANGKSLVYTIRFQNTGTYHAEKVRITDMLDTALYYPSFELIAASHEITSLELSSAGLLEIEFDQIFLPDSTAFESDSHGFVSFTIQRKKAFNPDVPVTNIAAIYFDFNEPIFTNTVSFGIPKTTASTTLLTNKKNKTFSVFPNPSTEKVFVDLSSLKQEQHASLRLLSPTGILIQEQAIQNYIELSHFDTSNLSSGIYLIQLIDSNGILTEKLVVLKK